MSPNCSESELITLLSSSASHICIVRVGSLSDGTNPSLALANGCTPAATIVLTSCPCPSSAQFIMRHGSWRFLSCSAIACATIGAWRTSSDSYTIRRVSEYLSSMRNASVCAKRISVSSSTSRRSAASLPLATSIALLLRSTAFWRHLSAYSVKPCTEARLTDGWPRSFRCSSSRGSSCWGRLDESGSTCVSSGNCSR